MKIFTIACLVHFDLNIQIYDKLYNVQQDVYKVQELYNVQPAVYKVQELYNVQPAV